MPREVPRTPSARDRIRRSVSIRFTFAGTRPTRTPAGQPLEDLAAYRLYYAPDLLRRGSDEYSLDTGMESEALVTGLSAGSWQFAVTAIDTAGNESDLSDIVLVEVGAE